MSRVHVVGAGLAGLAAAVRLAGQGVAVTLYDAAGHAGGRVRSYCDSELGCRVDNGNHLLLSGNRDALAFLKATGGIATLDRGGEARFPFLDLETGERWTVRPNRGRLPWWVLTPGRRVAGSRPAAYLEALRLRHAGPEAIVAEILDPASPLYRRLWAPLVVAALNTRPEQASARLFWRVLEETLGRGGAACRPFLPREGLSETFVDPALAFLISRGGVVRLGTRLRRLAATHDAATALSFDAGEVALGPGDAVILALPAPVSARMLPGLVVPEEHEPIVNAHFRHETAPTQPAFIGLVGGLAEWVFAKPGVLSVTISAAGGTVDRPAEDLAPIIWEEVTRAYGLGAAPLPPARIVKEKRATFRATPAAERCRPGAVTPVSNVWLAGDYTATGLPATMEGAIRSGFVAAQALIGKVEGQPQGAAGFAVGNGHRIAS